MADSETVKLTQRKPTGRYRVAGWKAAPVELPAKELEVVAGPFAETVLKSREATTYDRYRELVDRVTDAFGDETVASRWLSSPSSDFNAQPPIEVAKHNGYDVSVLEPVLIRIEHGVDF